MQASPFDLDDADSYARWRDAKLAAHPVGLEELVVEIADPHALSAAEKAAVMERIRRANMVIYATPLGDVEDKRIVLDLGRQFGLQRLDNNLCADEDAISSLEVADREPRTGYIPYTSRPIAWHTDGYYNVGENQIRGMVLHCVRPASGGGVNELLDHEIAYILLRERDPELIRALMHPQAMSIPPNVSGGEEIRGEVSGPVFSLLPGGQLHMRYTARSRSIHWHEESAEAAAILLEMLKTGSPYHLQGKLESGQGLLCNNVLHTRSGFEDGSRRLLYRGRYFDRIADS